MSSPFGTAQFLPRGGWGSAFPGTSFGGWLWFSGGVQIRARSKGVNHRFTAFRLHTSLASRRIADILFAVAQCRDSDSSSRSTLHPANALPLAGPMNTSKMFAPGGDATEGIIPPVVSPVPSSGHPLAVSRILKPPLAPEISQSMYAFLASEAAGVYAGKESRWDADAVDSVSLQQQPTRPRGSMPGCRS